MAKEDKDTEYVWRPQAGPQTAFVHCPVAEIFFGGARGGGKTDAAIGKMLVRCLQFGKGERGVFFRRTYKQLEEVMLRAHELFPVHKAKWREKDLSWTFPSGAWVKFAYLERDADAMNHQGKSYTCICIEEAGTFPSYDPIAKLKATLRSARGIPTQLLLTGNPGGPGANWIRQRYIDPAPMGWHPIKDIQHRLLPNGEMATYETERIYIPSRVTDNQILMQNDPSYIARLMDSGSEQLVKAWLEGDFYVIDGAFFDNFDQNKHVMKDVSLPEHWTHYRCADWGSYRPFAVYWIAVASEDWYHPTEKKLVPKNALVVYREWYGIAKKNDGSFIPNKGLKLYAEEVGKGILQRDGRDRIDFSVIDPSAYASDGGPSIAERLARGSNGKVMFRRADNKRVGPDGALGGWDQVRSRLGGEYHHNVDGDRVPMMFFFESCIHLLRTLPMMQHDLDRPEDLDTTAEDHAVDALRYGCMARPFAQDTPAALKKVTTIHDVMFDDLWADPDLQLM